MSALCHFRTHAPQQSRGISPVLWLKDLRHHFSRMTILAQLASGDVLDSAYEW